MITILDEDLEVMKHMADDGKGGYIVILSGISYDIEIEVKIKTKNARVLEELARGEEFAFRLDKPTQKKLDE